MLASLWCLGSIVTHMTHGILVPSQGSKPHLHWKAGATTRQQNFPDGVSNCCGNLKMNIIIKSNTVIIPYYYIIPIFMFKFLQLYSPNTFLYSGLFESGSQED